MKKFLEFQDIWDSITMKKIGRIMRCTLILLLVFSMNMVALDSYSQKSNITINLNNVSIERALDEIEKQSDFVFLYSSKLLEKQKNISINLNKKDIFEVLDHLFEGEKLKYTVIDNKVVISELPPPSKNCATASY